MAWPIGLDVQYRTGITLTATGTNPVVYTTSYGLSVNDLLTKVLGHVASYCNRDPALGFDEASVAETLDGELILPVKHPPIVSVTSVVWDETTLSAANEDYYVYTDYIRIAGTKLDDLEAYDPHRVTPRVVVVTYLGGYSDTAGTHVAIPAELKDIVLEVASRWLLRIDEQYRVNKNVDTYSIGNVRADFKSDLMADLRQRMNKFKVMRV